MSVLEGYHSEATVYSEILRAENAEDIAKNKRTRKRWKLNLGCGSRRHSNFVNCDKESPIRDGFICDKDGFICDGVFCNEKGIIKEGIILDFILECEGYTVYNVYNVLLDLEHPLPFKDHCISNIMLDGVLGHIKNKERLWKEMRRVIKYSTDRTFYPINYTTCQCYPKGEQLDFSGDGYQNSSHWTYDSSEGWKVRMLNTRDRQIENASYVWTLVGGGD